MLSLPAALKHVSFTIAEGMQVSASIALIDLVFFFFFFLEIYVYISVLNLNPFQLLKFLML